MSLPSPCIRKAHYAGRSNLLSRKVCCPTGAAVNVPTTIVYTEVHKHTTLKAQTCSLGKSAFALRRVLGVPIVRHTKLCVHPASFDCAVQAVINPCQSISVHIYRSRLINSYVTTEHEGHAVQGSGFRGCRLTYHLSQGHMSLLHGLKHSYLLPHAAGANILWC